MADSTEPASILCHDGTIENVYPLAARSMAEGCLSSNFAREVAFFESECDTSARSAVTPRDALNWQLIPEAFRLPAPSHGASDTNLTAAVLCPRSSGPSPFAPALAPTGRSNIASRPSPKQILMKINQFDYDRNRKPVDRSAAIQTGHGQSEIQSSETKKYLRWKRHHHAATQAAWADWPVCPKCGESVRPAILPLHTPLCGETVDKRIRERSEQKKASAGIQTPSGSTGSGRNKWKKGKRRLKRTQLRNS